MKELHDKLNEVIEVNKPCEKSYNGSHANHVIGSLASPRERQPGIWDAAFGASFNQEYTWRSVTIEQHGEDKARKISAITDEAIAIANAAVISFERSQKEESK